MPRIRLVKRDWMTIGVCVVIFALSLVVGISYFDDAFPEASIDFRYGRDDSEEIAVDYLKQHDLLPSESMKHVGIFDFDNNAKTYLEKELGLETASQYFGAPVELWYWSHRWFTPGEKEEYRVGVSPEGKTVSFRHMIKEEAEGASLTEAEARLFVEDFLFGTMKVDSTTVSFFESAKLGRPNRTDWDFTYKLNDFEPLKDSYYKYHVTLQGDQIGRYLERIHVPDAWQNDFSRLRSLNGLSAQIASFGLLLTMIAIGFIFVMKLRLKDLYWKTALIFGIIAAVLVAANDLNSLPFAIYGYDTTDTWSGFLIRTIAIAFANGIASGIGIGLLTAAAEAIFRERFPKMPSLPRLFTPRGLRTKRSFINIIVGLTMTGFFFAYQAIFYVISAKLGAWSPADLPYSNLLNTTMPWLAVLMIGFMPAVGEEFMSRLFSIPLLDKWFKGKYRWLAVLLPAVIWGFAHANYPNQPFYIRGVEVGIAGVIIGVIFLKFGILAPLVWHYTVDALYTAFALFGSDNIYFIATAGVGAGLLLIPLIIALVAYLRTGTFVSEEGLLNEDLGVKSADEAPAPELIEVASEVKRFKPISMTGRVVAVVAIVAMFLLAPKNEPGDFLEYSVERSDAIETVKTTLEERGIASADTLTFFAEVPLPSCGKSSNSLYLIRELGSVEAFNEMFEAIDYRPCWRVSGFKPGDKYSYYGTVDAQTGEVLGIELNMPEYFPSAKLPADSAQGMLERALAEAGIDLNGFDLESQSEKQHPDRTDHTFVWEAKEGDPRNVGKAKLRYSGRIIGDNVSFKSQPYFHISEEWKREREETSGLQSFLRILFGLMKAAVIGYAVVLLIQATKKGTAPWKAAFKLSWIPGLVFVLSSVNIYKGFQKATIFFSEWDPGVITSFGVMTASISTLLLYFAFVFGMVLVGVVFKDDLKTLRPGKSVTSVPDLLIAAVGLIGMVGFASVVVELIRRAVPSLLVCNLPVSSSIEMEFPFASMLNTIVTSSMVQVAVIGVLLVIWQKMRGKTFLRVLLLFGCALAMTTVYPTTAETLASLLYAALKVVAIALSLKLFVRGDAVRFVFALVGYVVFEQTMGVFEGAYSPLIIQSVIASAIALLALFFWASKFARVKE